MNLPNTKLRWRTQASCLTGIDVEGQIAITVYPIGIVNDGTVIRFYLYGRAVKAKVFKGILSERRIFKDKDTRAELRRVGQALLTMFKWGHSFPTLG